MINCIVCREDVPADGKCLRCGFDNNQVEKVNPFLAYFGSFWGILSILLIIPPLVLTTLVMMQPANYQEMSNPPAYVVAYQNMDAAFQPVVSMRVGAPIALLVTLIVAFYMFSLRIPIHHYSLTRRFKANPGRSIALWALIFFVSAVLLIFFLAFAMTSKDSIVATQGYYPMEGDGLLRYGSFGHLLLKLAMTGFLIFIFAFLSLAAGMMAAYLFGHYMEERRPNPIYLNEALLIKVVLDTVGQQLKVTTPNGEAKKLDSEDESKARITITTVGSKRLEDAGIEMMLECNHSLNKESDVEIVKAKTWTVNADCWGRVHKIEEKGVRILKVEKKETRKEQETKNGTPMHRPLDARIKKILPSIRQVVGSEMPFSVERLELLHDETLCLQIRQGEHIWEISVNVDDHLNKVESFDVSSLQSPRPNEIDKSKTERIALLDILPDIRRIVGERKNFFVKEFHWLDDSSAVVSVQYERTVSKFSVSPQGIISKIESEVLLTLPTLPAQTPPPQKTTLPQTPMPPAQTPPTQTGGAGKDDTS